MKIRAEKRKGECTQINDVETKKVFEHDETKNARRKVSSASFTFFKWGQE